YIYMIITHNWIDWQYFFDGPSFKQIVFGFIFGNFLSYWLMRAIRADQYKIKQNSFVHIARQVENNERDIGDDIQHHDDIDTQKFGIYSEIVMLVLLMGVFLVGVLDEETIARIARLGGNVKLPGGLEFAFGRNESRSSETSVAQLVPPANAQNSYAPPSVSQGLQSLAELGHSMRRDALIYALGKHFVVENHSNIVKDQVQNKEQPPEAQLFSRLAKHINLADEVFAKLASCLMEENNQNLDYISSGDKILPIAKKLNESIRMMVKIDHEDIEEAFPECEVNRNTIESQVGKSAINIVDKNNKKAIQNGIKYIVDANKAAEMIDVSSSDSPYAWIAAANIFEYNHRYVAAIALLENWLKTRKGKIKDEALAEVFEVRVRSLISGYLYEWMNYQPIAKTQAVLELYRRNLEKTILLLDNIIYNTFSAENIEKPAIFGARHQGRNTLATNWVCGNHRDGWAWSDVVSIPGKKDLPPQRMKLSLISSLLSMKQSWINAVLDGADYNDYRNRAREYAQELRDADVSCMGIVGANAEEDRKGENYVRVLRAQNLDAYARVTRVNANLLQDAAARKSQLSGGLSAAEEGLELAKEIAERDRNRRRSDQSDKGISFTTSGTSAIEVVERLGEVIRRTNTDLGRL
ncbi:MAG: hypothetical protein AB7F41_10705, partial [Methylocystis sp.]